MAADKTGIDNVTDTLTANTARKVSLTGAGNRLELIHQSAVTNPVYYTTATTEAGLTTATVGGAENRVLLAGERLTLNMPRSGSTPLWFSLISAGAAVISMEMLPT